VGGRDDDRACIRGGQCCHVDAVVVDGDRHDAVPRLAQRVVGTEAVRVLDRDDADAPRREHPAGQADPLCEARADDDLVGIDDGASDPT
jgi:hypothetical protein